MNNSNIAQRKLLIATLMGSVLFYAIISLLISFLHTPGEDPTCFHDNCPACRWEKQSQESPIDYNAQFSSHTVHEDSFAGLIRLENSFLHSQELFISYPTRSPPFIS
jgi:hypothetical protein